MDHQVIVDQTIMEIIGTNRKNFDDVFLFCNNRKFSLLVDSRKGSSFGGKAASFAAGAAGGIAAYSLMRSMAGSYHSRPYGRYGPGYGCKLSIEFYVK